MLKPLARSPHRTFATPLFFRPDGDGTDDGVKPDGTDDGRPDWLPANFTDGAALAKSYDESRKEMDRLRSELETERTQFAAALDKLEEMQPPQPQPQGDAQTNALLADYERAVSSGDAAAQLAITLALQTQVMDQRLEERFKTLEPKLEGQSKADRDIAFEIAQDRVATGYGDQWAGLQPDVQKWLHEHSAWLPTTNSPEAFENVIREAAKTVVNEKAAEQLAELQADRAAKLTAQTATGSGSGRHSTIGDEKKQAWDEVKQADVGSYGQMRGS